MESKTINKFRLGGFIGACVAAVFTFMAGDVVTAGGLVAAALSTSGLKVD